MRRSIIYIMLLVFTSLVGCETDADIELAVERKTVVYGFVEAGNSCVIYAYQSIFFTEPSAKVPLGEDTYVTITVNKTDSYTKAMPLGATGMVFEDLDLRPGSSIMVEVESENEKLVYANSYIPTEPNAELLRCEEVEREGKRYKQCVVKLYDEGTADNYYQLIARDTETGELIEDIQYQGRIFEESKASAINEGEGRGLFTNANKVGKIIYLNFSVPVDEVGGDVEIELYHMTYEHYCYVQSVAIHKEYMILPVFSQNGVYNNVVNGVGLLSGIGCCKILVP